MALTVTGIDPATGRVIPKGTNVIIPPESAGIGDIVFCKSGADPQVASNLRVIGWGTTNNANITIDGSTYVPYGVIYGFVNGMARVVALTETSRRWTMAASDSGSESATGDTNVSGGYPVADSTVGGGNNAMRNGKKTTYVGMNLNSLMQNGYTGGNTIVHPGAAWDATQIMSRANFEALDAGAGNAKTLYGTWENYVRQALASLLTTANTRCTSRVSGTPISSDAIRSQAQTPIRRVTRRAGIRPRTTASITTSAERAKRPAITTGGFRLWMSCLTL